MLLNLMESSILFQHFIFLFDLSLEMKSANFYQISHVWVFDVYFSTVGRKQNFLASVCIHVRTHFNGKTHKKVVNWSVSLRPYLIELRPSIRSLEIWLGSLENSPARPRSRSKMLEKNLLDFCSDRKKIENFMLEIARIETQCSKCSLDDRNQNLI